MRALRLRGFRLEAALTRALAAGVRLRRAKRTARREIAVLTPDPDALRALAEESGIAVRDEGERGLGRWIKKFKRRWTLLPGLILGLWLIAAFSARMWVIRIEAAPQGELDGAARAHIAALLEDMDIVPGSSRPDTRALSAQLAAQCPELSYVSARLTGARLLISAQSAGPQPEIYDPRAERDLTASRDGIVWKVNVAAGQAAVKPGDTVRRGDILILGQEKGPGGEIKGVRALGTVTARAWSQAEASAPLIARETAYTGRVRASARLVGPLFEAELSRCEPFAMCETETRRYKVVGLFLPAYVERTEYRETEVRLRREDPQALESRLRAQALSEAAEGAENDILRVWTRTETSEGRMRVRAVIEYTAQIASEK